MLKFRTTKKVQTSLHDDSTNYIEFQFRYGIDWEAPDTFSVRVDAYAISDEDESLTLIPGGGSYRKIEDADLSNLMSQAQALTLPIEGEMPLEYFNRLVESGIRIVIISESLWKNTLQFDDFE